MKNSNKYLVFFLLLSIFGCSQNSNTSGREMVDEEVALPKTEQISEETIERKLIKEGWIEFETRDLSATRKNIFDAVNKYKGYVSSDMEFKSPDRQSNTIMIRVPANNFDNLLQEATIGVEKFENKQINVKDVTEEFLDIQARLKTKKELESRYLELLKQAKNTVEILEIEKQIGQLRTEIESVEGRLNYIQNQVSFSTLTLTFYESIPNHTEFGEKFRNGFRNGWDNLIWFFVFLINIWPFILIILLVIISWRIYKKKK